MKKKLLSMLLILCMLLTMLPVTALAGETGGVTYLDENGEEQTAPMTPTPVSSTDTSWGTSGQTTWYVAAGDADISNSVNVSGHVHLILTDGCDLTVTGAINSAGIDVTGANSLSIYGQEGGTGKLTAQGGENGAGIGGGDAASCGTVTISGGTVTAKGGKYAAGIGAGKKVDGAPANITGGAVTIFGGTVSATGGEEGAGIGGGKNGNGGTVTISGGTVTAKGGEGGAGIGSGKNVDYGGNVIISGGTVFAREYDGGAGIGSGEGGNFFYGYVYTAGTVTITGGSIIAQGSKNSYLGTSSANIGHGSMRDGDGPEVQPKNAGGQDLYLTTATLGGVNSETEIASFTTTPTYEYGINDLKTNATGNLGFYLPQGTVVNSVTVGSEIFYPIQKTATVNGSFMMQVGSTADTTMAASGAQVEIKASPDTGYEVETITVTKGGGDQVPVTANKFTMPAESVTVTVTFRKAAYTIIKTAPTNGSFTFEVEGVETAAAGYNDEVTVVVTPNAGYEVDTISVTQFYGSTVPVTDNKFTMPAMTVRVTVTFRKLAYAISKTAPTNGSFTLEVGGIEADTADYNEEVTVAATPNTGYEVDTITVTKGGGDQVPVTGNSFTMPAETVTVTVTFRKLAYAISKTAPTNGSFTLEVEGVETAAAGYNDEVTLVAIPNAGYALDTITVTKAGGAQVPVTDSKFTMPAETVTVTITFTALPTYTLTVEGVGDGGTTGGTHYTGEVVSINAGTNPGHTFSGWTSNHGGTFGNASLASTTFTMPPGSVTITASWTADSGGGIIPTPDPTPEPTPSPVEDTFIFTPSIIHEMIEGQQSIHIDNGLQIIADLGTIPRNDEDAIIIKASSIKDSGALDDFYQAYPTQQALYKGYDVNFTVESNHRSAPVTELLGAITLKFRLTPEET